MTVTPPPPPIHHGVALELYGTLCVTYEFTYG